jgi:hypothetical protein
MLNRSFSTLSLELPDEKRMTYKINATKSIAEPILINFDVVNRFFSMGISICILILAIDMT